MTKSRTDVHRPVELTPEDYEEVGWYDLGNSEERPVIQLSPEARADDSVFRGVYGTQLHRCDHCGARLRYGAELLHRPTGDHIHVGETCLGNRFSRSRSEFHALRKAAQLDREKQRLLTEWIDFQSTHAADWAGLHASTNRFIADVLGKGRRYGNISDKQFNAIVQAFERDNAPEGEAEKTVDVPEGTQTITGTIISVKLQDSYYGETLKCLVKVETPEGSFKVWGSVPASLRSAIVDYSQSVRRANGAVDPPTYRTGLQVRFTATLERSTDDRAFGFFKRPRKAEVVEEVRTV